MSQRLNPTGHITGPGPNAMQRGDYGPWNLARVRPSPVPCEQAIYHKGGMLNDIHKTSHQNPCSYAVPCDVIYLYQSYPREAEVLHQVSDRLHRQDNLFMPDMVFSNAIFRSKVLKEGDQTKYSRLKAHIERGLFDIPVDELPMVTRGEKNLYHYMSAGDAMLLEYCNHLNVEVREVMVVD